ncbi:MAG: cupin domain-containing protein [Bacteroidota bacterium]
MNQKKLPSTNEASIIIEKLNLLPHPEGGWYSEVYRSDDILQANSLPERYKSPHCFSTSIYFLLESNDFSAFHRITSDETWHFYSGSPVVIYCIFPDGSVSHILMGNNLNEGHLFQFTIKRNCWFAAKIQDVNSFTLIGCTVSPGFEFPDFELADRYILLKMFPQNSALISELTRA